METTIQSSFFGVKSRKQIMLHISIWTIFVFMHLIQSRPGEDLINFSNSSLFVINIILFYLNYLILVPRLLLHKKTGLYIFCAIVFIAFFTFLFRELNYEFNKNYNVFNRGPMPYRGARSRHFFWGLKGAMIAINSFLILAIGTIIRMYTEWSSNEITTKQIEAQKS